MTDISIGLLTYQHPHLKTEQVLQQLLTNENNLKIYALPFKKRKIRKTFINHRPNQSFGIEPKVLAEKHGTPYIACHVDTAIDDSCDIYLVLGAGILSAESISKKRILNCHPGIIPSCRGLDSFKWALYDMKPLGVTLHFIDAEVDAGEIVCVVPTNVYPTDTIESLARRHYENELQCLANFKYYLKNPHNPYHGIQQDTPKMRMPIEKERELPDLFHRYLKLFSGLAER